MPELFANDSYSTLNGSINNAVTSLTVNSAAGFPGSGTFRIRIDDEIMTVTGVAGNVFTVTRASEAVNGVTTAAAHNSGAVVQLTLTAGSLANVVLANQIVTSAMINLTIDTAIVTGTETTSSASYVNLATTEAVTPASGATQDYELTLNGQMRNSGSVNDTWGSVAINGAAATDNEAIYQPLTTGCTVERTMILTAQASGNTHTRKYKTGGGTLSILVRTLITKGI